jgi:hypothetical protein
MDKKRAMSARVVVQRGPPNLASGLEARSANSLGFAVYESLLKDALLARRSNVLVSPLSLAIAFAMLDEGAAGRVQAEIEEWLPPEIALDKAALADVVPRGAGAVANSLWHRAPPDTPGSFPRSTGPRSSTSSTPARSTAGRARTPTE